MSSIGPLGPPQGAPIVNPVLWAPELPSNRPPPQPPLPHAIHAQHLVPHNRMREGFPMETPMDIEKRAEAVRETSFRPVPNLQSAGLLENYSADLALKRIHTDSEAGVGTYAQDDQATQPTGSVILHYTSTTGGQDTDDGLGDGSVADATRVIDAIRGGDTTATGSGPERRRMGY